MKFSKIMKLTLVFALVLSIMAPVASAAEKKLIRIGCTSTQDSNYGQGMIKFKEAFDKYTNNAYDVQLFPAGQLGQERDLIEGVSMGTIEMCVSSTGPLLNFSQDFMLLDMPYVIENTPEGRKKAYEFMDGKYGQQMLASLEPMNIKALGFWENGFRNVINSRREVHKIEDVNGLKIRTMENEVHMSFYNLNGGNAVPMASSEAFTALQQGVIDGMDNVIDGLFTQKAYEAAKYLALSGHFYSPSVIMMNLDLYNSLPDEHKEMLHKAQAEARDWERKFTQDTDIERMQIMKDYGTVLIDIDINEWKKSAKVVHDQFRSRINPEYVKALLGE